MSEIQFAQLHSELFERRHSTLQPHGLFALAKRLYKTLMLKQALMFGFEHFMAHI